MLLLWAVVVVGHIKSGTLSVVDLWLWLCVVYFGKAQPQPQPQPARAVGLLRVKPRSAANHSNKVGSTRRTHERLSCAKRAFRYAAPHQRGLQVTTGLSALAAYVHPLHLVYRLRLYGYTISCLVKFVVNGRTCLGENERLGGLGWKSIIKVVRLLATARP